MSNKARRRPSWKKKRYLPQNWHVKRIDDYNIHVMTGKRSICLKHYEKLRSSEFKTHLKLIPGFKR